MELALRFPTADQVIVELYETGRPRYTEPLSFESPLTEADQEDLHWYLEIFPAHYATEVDDARATRIAARLEQWGSALFDAVFKESHAAGRFFDTFAQHTEPGRLLTVDSGSPSVLAQPWELLRHPERNWLFLEKPRVSVCRRLSGQGATAPFEVTAKDRLHLLFVVSRPQGAGFIDPRADPQAVMDALQARAPGRVSVEFLRPPTISNLIDRLEDEDRPPVDILHFDGHGLYDADGRMADEAEKGLPASFRRGQDAEADTQQGYLLLEKKNGGRDEIPAARLGGVFNQQAIGLVVLSACQSAKVGGDDPLGSVAAQLTRAGIPTVIAMTHSVLVDTTRAFFGHFYGGLGRGRRLGEALENARRKLYMNPERGERRRAERRITLELQDWFLPALYQNGEDTAFLTKSADKAKPPEAVAWGNLPELKPWRFWGRSRELWDIERHFVTGTRRLVVHGFGGQGKTYLAEEAGRWLHRSGLFERVCLVRYADFQGVDPVGFAISTLATVLDASLLDAEAATAALARTPTLLILDNLETLIDRDREGHPDRTRLNELLSAVTAFSAAGASRVLITTRTPELGHPDFPTEGDPRCRYLNLEGLAPEDALDWFQALIKLPPDPEVPLPAREALLALFKQVGFHPLSIGLLARELKTRRPAELGERLEALLAADNDRLRASLTLSLDRLSPEAQTWLPRLGVFQGGTFEDCLLRVTDLTSEQWAELRPGLEATGLVHAEDVPSVNSPYLRFHPTLAPAMWQRLTPETQAALRERFRCIHHQLAKSLYDQFTLHAHATRAIAVRVLPNLLAAVYQALEAKAPDAAYFAQRVQLFLVQFGYMRERAKLIQMAEAAPGASKTGTEESYLARQNHGEDLIRSGNWRDAQKVFEEILSSSGETMSFRRCQAKRALGRCYKELGNAGPAENMLRQALVEADNLEFSEADTHAFRRIVNRERSVLHEELGNLFSSKGEYPKARDAYREALAIAGQQNDESQVAVIQQRVGELAFERDQPDVAEKHLKEALKKFQQLNDPRQEASVLFSLGKVYTNRELWKRAESALRASAQIKTDCGDSVTANWEELAVVAKRSGNRKLAAEWYRKALEARRLDGEPLELSYSLQNLAEVLRYLPEPECLDEARGLAEEALNLKLTLDPDLAMIWTTYQILAEIAEKQGNYEPAAGYHRKAQTAWADYPGSRESLRIAGDMISKVVRMVGQGVGLTSMPQDPERERAAGHLGELDAAICLVLAGERDYDTLCSSLHYRSALIVKVILDGIRNPDTVQELLGPVPSK